MSDDYPTYNNAWSKAMSETKKKLAYMEHWWKLAPGIKSNKKCWKKNVSYINFLELIDEEIFSALMNRFIANCKRGEELGSFLEYFQTYVNRCKLWARCYRTAAGINTNMYLEFLHKVLKYIYMKEEKK